MTGETVATETPCDVVIGRELPDSAPLEPLAGVAKVVEVPTTPLGMVEMVSADLREPGLRGTLNYGRTLGHRHRDILASLGRPVHYQPDALPELVETRRLAKPGRPEGPSAQLLATASAATCAASR